MIRGKEWLKNEIEIMGSETSENYPHEQMVDREEVLNLIDLLEEPEKVVIPRFVAEAFEKARGCNVYTESIFKDMYNSSLEVTNWLVAPSNEKLILRAWLDGYEVEKEILWEIPMPYLKTTGGHIQYLTYDPKARTYFASRKHGKLKQTFNAKDLASVPGQYRRHAEMCGFKKIQEVAE